MTNFEKYKDVFVRIFGVNPDILGETFTFKDVEIWDSVAHLSLISELEDVFDVMFESEDILPYGSFDNGILILRKYGVDI